jgi:hypothetical protein
MPLLAIVTIVAVIAGLLIGAETWMKGIMAAGHAANLEVGLRALLLGAVPWLACHASLRHAGRRRVAAAPLWTGLVITALCMACMNLNVAPPSVPGGQAAIGGGIGFSTEPGALLAIAGRCLGVLAMALLTARRWWRTG